MREIEITKSNKCFNNLIGTYPNKNDYGYVINENCILKENGRIVGIYYFLTEKDVAPIRYVSLNTKNVKTYRAHRAIPTQSSVFGALPRTAVRVDYCRFSEHTRKEKANYIKAFKFLEKLCEIYKQYLPQAYSDAKNFVENTIHKDYLPFGGPFTTCNFNVNHAIKYHKDAGNVTKTFSNVVILKDGIQGGELVLPEYNVALSQGDRALLIFDGQNVIHGVNKLVATKPKAYRSSIVYYTLAGMKHCYPYQEELNRIKTLKTIRARKRV